MVMPVLLVPALFIGGTAGVVGGGYFLLHGLHVIAGECERRGGTNKEGTRAPKKQVEKVMHEHKRGTLKSGSGKKVKSRKQAIAIAMSESGQSKKRKKAS